MSFSHSEIFPADRTAAIKSAFEKAFGNTIISEASLLHGGLSGAAVYKIVADNRPYVMKLVGPGSSFEKTALAAAAGIAPPLIYKQEESGIIITAFIENKPIRAIFRNEELAAELAIATKKIHSVPYSTSGENLQEVLNQLMTVLRNSHVLSGPVPDECLQQFERVRKIYPWDDTDKVFSHNDLNPTNVLCDGKTTWIIDWDSAFLNDRYIDLAGLANFFLHTPAQETVFLQQYFGEVSVYNTARFFVMRQISRIIYAVMMLQLAGQGKPADYPHDQQMEGIYLKDIMPLLGMGELSLSKYEGQFMYGKALLNEAVLQMRTEKFEASLEVLAGLKA